MHIHHDMYGYWNAVWGSPASQADAARSARWTNAGGASGAPVTQEGAEDPAPAGGGNPILQALAQALESLGLSLTTPTASSSTTAPTATASGTTAATAASTTASSATASSTTASSTTGSSTTATSTTATSTTAASTATAAAAAPAASDHDHDISSEERTIAGDVRHLMHALFEDVRAENLLAPSSGSASGSSTPGSSFASGLAALINQIQSGSAPANLQRAFDALVADLTGAQPAATTAQAPSTTQSSTPAPVTTPVADPAPTTAAASSSTAAPASTLNTQALLVQFLTNLQSDLGLGYGGSAATPAQSATSGVMVNTAA